MSGQGVRMHLIRSIMSVFFPGIFRGAIDTRARQINEEMKVAAAYAIADLIDSKDLREDYVIPDPFDPRVAPAVAAAVAKEAVNSGVARIDLNPEVVRANTAARVKEIGGGLFMRTVEASLITETVAKLAIEANYQLTEDIYAAPWFLRRKKRNQNWEKI